MEMQKGIELVTQRAENIMQQIADDITALMLMPYGTPEAKKEKEWGKISNKYQKLAKPYNLNPYDLEQFKEYVMQNKKNELKEKLMEWARDKAHAIEYNGSLTNLEDDDALIAIGQIHTLAVANLLIEFLHFNGIID